MEKEEQSNLLMGTYNRLLPLTDKEKLCNISLILDDSHLQRIPKSEKKTVWACSYGWLLISQKRRTESCKSYEFSVWKPESGEVINLPPMNLEPDKKIHAATLVSSPGNPGSMVLLYEEVLRQLIFYRFYDKQWTKILVDKEIAEIGQQNALDDGISKNRITQCNGKLYAATCRTGNLMVIEENMSGNLELRPLNCRMPMFPSHAIRFCEYLLDFCGQLCSVFITWGGVNEEDIVDIEVSKLDFSGDGMKWVKVTSEDGQGHAFFLSDNYAFSCPVNKKSEIEGRCPNQKEKREIEGSCPNLKEKEENPKEKEEIEGGCVYLCVNNRLYSVNIQEKRFSVSLPLENFLQSEESPFLSMNVFRFCCPQAKSEPVISKLEAVKEGEPGVIEANGNICDLPLDTLEFVSDKLNPVDYNNFRSVGNTFRSVAPQIKWSETSCDFESQSLYPWLIFREGDIHNFVDPRLGVRYLSNFPKLLSEAKIRYSKDGWLLMYTSKSLFFYNPFKKEWIELPLEEEGLQLCFGYGLVSSPTMDTIMVGIDYHSIYYFSWKEEEWELDEYVFPDFDFQPNHNCPIYFDGAFYLLGRDGKLGVFRWKDNGEVSWEILKELQSPCNSFCYNYLLECSGHLLSVFVDDGFVHVYKLIYTEAMAWEKVTSLGNHALFVSPSSSFSITPYFSDMKNKVYFPKLFGGDIVYYCLSTDKFYTCGNKEVVADFSNTTEFLFSSWIQPDWSS